MTPAIVLKPNDSLEIRNEPSAMQMNRKRTQHSCKRITKRRQIVAAQTEIVKQTQFCVTNDAVARLQDEQADDLPKFRSHKCNSSKTPQNAATEFTSLTASTVRYAFDSQLPDSWTLPPAEQEVPGPSHSGAAQRYSQTVSVHRSAANRWNRSVLIAIFTILHMVTAISSLPQQQQQQQPHANQQPAAFIGCTTCHERRQVEDQSLDFFKTHILKRLDMEKPPNITAVPLVADDVIKGFYRQHGYRYIRLNREAGAASRSASGEPNYDGVDYDGMQADDPQYDSSSELNYFENYGERFGGMEAEDDEDEEEQFFSTTDSIFAFPKRM